MKNSRTYNSEINTQSDQCSFFINHPNLTHENNEKTNEITFDLTSVLRLPEKLVWAEDTKGPGRKETGDR